MNYNATGASFKYYYVNKIAKEINCEKWLFRLFHQAVLLRDRRQSEVPVGVWRKMRWSRSAWMILRRTYQAVTCLSVASVASVAKTNENELILARVRIRGLAGIRN